MKPVQLNRLVIGFGLPKLCVPIVACSPEKVVRDVETVVCSPADLCEWRLDMLDGLSLPAILRTAVKVRKILGEMPLLATFRSSREGGKRKLADDAYIRLYNGFIAQQAAEAVDIEWSRPSPVRRRLTAAAHRSAVKVILSHHDFKRTPPYHTLKTMLAAMAAEHADIAKIAVMPQSAEDVLTLMSATLSMQKRLNIPIVTMAMGQLGKISRIGGCLTGSAITFGSLGRASAPGQINAAFLKKILEELAENV